MDNKTINLEVVEPTDKPPMRSKRGEVTKELFENIGAVTVAALSDGARSLLANSCYVEFRSLPICHAHIQTGCFRRSHREN